MVWLGVLCGVLLLVVLVLGMRIWLLYRAIDGIGTELERVLSIETNTLLTTASADRRIKRLVASLNHHLRLMRSARLDYETGNRELKEAIAGISHDLRTPLTAIYGYLRLLKQAPLSSDASRHLAVIENRVDAMRQLTEELLRYTVVSSAGDDLTPEPLSLSACLEESIIAHYAALTERGIAPAIDMPQAKVVRMLDRAALQRVFDNILANAIKYSAGDLTIALAPGGDITFSNAAPGLDEVSVGRLFDRFFTVESARQSTGLGLSIARTLTNQMGGTLGAEYKNGQLIIHLSFPE